MNTNPKGKEVQMMPTTMMFETMFPGVIQGITQGIIEAIRPAIQQTVIDEVSKITSHVIEKPMNVDEASKFLGVHRDTVHDWVASGKIPPSIYHKINSRPFLFASELVAFIKKS